MKNLKKFNEITDYHNMDNYYEVEPGRWVPKGTLSSGKKPDNKSHIEFLSTFINDLKGLYESIIKTGVCGEEQVKFIEELYEINKRNSSISEGKTMKSTTDKDTDVRKENFRKTISSLIKSKGCDTKTVGDDFEIHCGEDHIGQVIFRDKFVGVKKKGVKFTDEFKYDELGKIKAKVSEIIKACKDNK